MRFLLLFVSLLFVETTWGQEASSISVIPMPAKLVQHAGEFTITSKTRIVVPDGAPDWAMAADALNDRLAVSVGYRLAVGHKGGSGNAIKCELNPKVAKEGYKLKVKKSGVTVEASDPSGFFYALQTVRQLLPKEVESSAKVEGVKLSLPCVDVEDAPRFAYRGMHLDVCRHFYDVAFVKRYIDQLAFHKLNTFHWHLTEDQGWRIEIKKYPKLTTVGAWRDGTVIGRASSRPYRYDTVRHGGFYTQDQIKEVVEYARKRFITVIPEIEMPGHALAALASYPELSCSGGPFDVMTRWGIFRDVYCAKDETFSFLEDVLTEVIDLFPSKYIHIGGDECPKVRWKRCKACQDQMQKNGLKNEEELQSYFITRIEKFLNSKGREIIGWDEILEGGLAPNATVMSWRGIKGGIEAAKQHHNVIMTPGNPLYFDHYQAKTGEVQQPLAIGGYNPIDSVYAYNPVPKELTSEQAKYIIGAQANVWTEFIPTEAQVEYMVFPRISALAETVWTPLEQKDLEKFKQRLEKHKERYAIQGIRYFGK